jgi:hypothetical protein
MENKLLSFLKINDSYFDFWSRVWIKFEKNLDEILQNNYFELNKLPLEKIFTWKGDEKYILNYE